MVDLAHKTSLTSCDNTPTVSWVSRLVCTSSTVATELLKVWGSRMAHANIPRPLIHYLEGTANLHADYASRKFNTTLANGSTQPITDFQFLTNFNAEFPLPQNASWRLFHLNSSVVSRIFAILQTQPCTMALWRQVTTKGNAFGTIGSSTATSLTWTPASPTALTENDSPPWLFSPKELETASIPQGLVSECKRYKLQCRPSARPLNWMASPTHATNQGSK